MSRSYIRNLFRSIFTCNFHRASTPSSEVEVNPESSQRRGSNGTLISSPLDEDVEIDSVHLLNRDSQRRITLVKVLEQEAAHICELWMHKIREKYLGETVLTDQHFQTLMDGIKRYITDPSPLVIEPSITRLKEELGCNANTISQLHFAIYSYQVSVNDILRHLPMKPHWIFVLDNLARSAVQAALFVLSPELEETFSSPSTPTTGNSRKISKNGNSSDLTEQLLKIRNEIRFQIQNEMRNENLKLLEEFRESTRDTNAWLREELKRIWSMRYPLREEVKQDQLLANWLAERELYPYAKALLTEGYTLDYVLNNMTLDELRFVGLRPGVEIRVWEAITESRRFRQQQAEMVRGNVIVHREC